MLVGGSATLPVVARARSNATAVVLQYGNMRTKFTDVPVVTYRGSLCGGWLNVASACMPRCRGWFWFLMVMADLFVCRFHDLPALRLTVAFLDGRVRWRTAVHRSSAYVALRRLAV